MEGDKADPAGDGSEEGGIEWRGIEWRGIEWRGIEWRGIEWRGTRLTQQERGVRRGDKVEGDKIDPEGEGCEEGG